MITQALQTRLQTETEMRTRSRMIRRTTFFRRKTTDPAASPMIFSAASMIQIPEPDSQTIRLQTNHSSMIHFSVI